MASEAQPAKARGGKMLFVSRLPYSVTTDTLNEYFGDIGPLRKAFVVTDKESHQSKGVAYVQYALADDAQRAVEQLGNKPIPGVEGAPRPIRIELARTREPPTEGQGRKRPAEQAEAGAKKPRVEQARPVKQEIKQEIKQESEEEFKPKPKQQKVVPSFGPTPTPAAGASASASAPHVSKEDRALAQRTLVVTGLARCNPPSDSKQLYKRVRKLGDVEEVLYPPPGEKGKGKDVAHVRFRTPNHAHLAVPKLDGHVYKSATLRAHLKARLDARSRLEKTITNPETRARREAAAEKVRACSLLAAIEALKLPHASLRVPGQGPLDGMELLSHASGGALANGRIERRNRLIVRNLPFDITEEDLKAYFLPFGPLYEVDVPQVEKKARVHKHTRGKQEDEDDTMEVEKQSEESGDDDSESEDGNESEQSDDEESEEEDDASEEEEDSDDVKVKSESESESEDIKVKSEPKSESEDVKVKSESESDTDSESDADAEPSSKSESKPETKPEVKATRGRGFAFVWFVSYGDAERALSLSETEMQHGQAERVALVAAKNSGLGVVRRKAKKARDAVLQHAHPARKVSVQLALAKDEYERTKPLEASDGEASDEEQEKEEKEEKEKSRPPPPEEGTTLFVRNVPFSANEKEFAALFRHFGPMRYARLVLGSDKTPRGTGFVSFWDKDHADACLALARRVAEEAATSEQGEKEKDKDGKHYSSVLTADAGSALAAPLTLQGRVLVVLPAMDRSDASAIAADRVAARAKTDKRNTYLLREGVPFAHSPLASEVGEKDAEVRLQSFGVRKQQLSANAALYVSPTRLSVRRLPLWVGDVELRKLAQLAIRQFDEEVKQGKRDPLAPAEAEAKGFDPGSVPIKGVHARVIRQKDRLDLLFASRGLGRSMGYGFVEVPSLPYALKVLRYLNAWREGLPTLQKLHKAELQGTQKHLTAELKKQTGDKREETELLLKRIEARLKELETSHERGGRLLVEFALENATITRKRRERTLSLKAGNERKARDPNQTRAGKGGERQWGKLAAAKADTQIKDAKKQRGMGGVIARKRREKKAKHKGAKA